MLNSSQIRQDFPILRRKMNGKPLVFLDNGASTQKPEKVINAIKEFYETGYSNIHRGIYALSESADQKYEDVRGKVAKFIKAPSRNNIVFTHGTTESINLVAHGWGQANLKKGDEIILSQMEHHANIVPWHMLAKKTGCKLRFIKIKKDFTLDMEDYKKLLNKKTKLVAVTHVSNVLGTINPVQEIIKLAHDVGATTLIDGAQSAPHMPIDVRDMNCDFFVLSAHKMCGPTGVGILYGKQEILEGMEPFMGGGDMIEEVTEKEVKFKKAPEKFEAGTPNIEGVIGFGAAIDYLRTIGMGKIHKHNKILTEKALKKLGTVPGLAIHGPRDPDKRAAVFAFTIDGIHAHDIADMLDKEGIAVRSGKHCAHPLLCQLNEVAMTRASFYFYNTEEEIKKLIEALNKIIMFFDKKGEKNNDPHADRHAKNPE